MDATTGVSGEAGSRRRRDGICGVIGVRDERGVWGERSSMDSGLENEPRRLLAGELSRFTSIPMKVLGAQEASIQGLCDISYAISNGGVKHTVRKRRQEQLQT